MKHTLIFGLVITACSVALAEPPKAVIVVDGQVVPDGGKVVKKVGAINVIDATQSVGEFFEFKVRPNLSGDVKATAAEMEQYAEYLRSKGATVVLPTAESGNEELKIQSGKMLILPTYPGDYFVVPVVGNAEGVSVSSLTIVVEGTLPPGPGPKPPDPVDPIPPPIGLSAQVAAEVAKAVTASTQPKWVALAESYDKLADSGIDSVETFTAMSGALDLFAPPAWADIRARVVEPKLSALVTVADYVATWKEIAAGIRTGAGGQPPPDPVDPDVDPPIPAAGLRVLIIEETKDRLEGRYPASQVRIFTSTKVLGWLRTNAPNRWRIWDDDVPASKAPPEFQAALKRARGGLPWIVISNGTTGYEGPLPANESDTLALLEKYKP